MDKTGAVAKAYLVADRRVTAGGSVTEVQLGMTLTVSGAGAASWAKVTATVSRKPHCQGAVPLL